MTGEDADNYMKEKEQDGISTYVVTDLKDAEIGEMLENIFNSSTKTPDNPKSKYYNKSIAHIIDSYELTDNNCTTFVSDAVNKMDSKALNINRIQQHSTLGTFTSYSEQERFVIPASLKKHLDNISVRNNVVYKTK